jgi:hypothetical protein
MILGWVPHFVPFVRFENAKRAVSKLRISEQNNTSGTELIINMPALVTS